MLGRESGRDANAARPVPVNYPSIPLAIICQLRAIICAQYCMIIHAIFMYPWLFLQFFLSLKFVLDFCVVGVTCVVHSSRHAQCGCYFLHKARISAEVIAFDMFKAFIFMSVLLPLICCEVCEHSAYTKLKGCECFVRYTCTSSSWAARSLSTPFARS